MGYFDTTSPGALISHLTVDADKVGSLRDIVPHLTFPIAQVIYGGYVLLTISWQLTLVVTAMLTLEFLEASIRSKHVTHRYSSKYTIENRNATDRGSEILQSITTVRSHLLRCIKFPARALKLMR